ncbi:(ZYRO0B14454g) [Zygosaccharomyces parabailii]|uniref:ZYBA0S11-03598g1_1 n=1 Tax=Zygosaccharomyces bailii (strain CLIB 213 / ATCC 58445 / CBS 680 / BCRC 21525 / NBRC 1098 / NCYC 1416 / NRRL Y-2227) TaxID=1333698 RepID=A0A8J2TBK9_ZYGB2|nr:(ZYRO0B14454g) [Zygosaccharomyces parabailii]CDF91471.1 ZYBA0S11-03598g1_1 [Zygosaccharomyces bailii CLIB 213]CDH17104.1 uncharacterized protein ZBAI_08892 [Zygosaccharomyces bailii ISA1307]
MVPKCERQADYESYSPSYYSAKSPDSQMVDPEFNKLLFNFQYVATNTEALYHACEQYKRSLRCFFSESAKMFELFHELLVERDLTISHPPSPNAPEYNGQDSFETPFLLRTPANSSTTGDSPLDIGRLRRQMLVIARRAEQDLLFFENSVQGPLAKLIKMSYNVKRISSRRDAANAEWGQLAARHHDQIRSRTASGNNRQQIEPGLVKRLQGALAKYEALNEMCKDGLKNYLRLLSELFRDWFRNYYYTVLRIAYALHHFSWSIPEFRKIGVSHGTCPNESNNTYVTASSVATAQLCQEFHALHDAAAKQVATLFQGAPNSTSFAD